MWEAGEKTDLFEGCYHVRGTGCGMGDSGRGSTLSILGCPFALQRARRSSESNGGETQSPEASLHGQLNELEE